MRSKLLLAVLLCVGLTTAASQQVNAHVLIANEDDAIGAVLHITPDDDPIAGSDAQIFYDIQDGLFDDGGYDAQLTVRDTTTGREDTVKMNVDGSYVSGEYRFATQGVYRLTLAIDYEGRTERFVVTQRVSRGTPATTRAAQSRHQWAELLLVLSGVGCVALVLIALTRGRRILAQSR